MFSLGEAENINTHVAFPCAERALCAKGDLNILLESLHSVRLGWAVLWVRRSEGGRNSTAFSSNSLPTSRIVDVSQNDDSTCFPWNCRKCNFSTHFFFSVASWDSFIYRIFSSLLRLLSDRCSPCGFVSCLATKQTHSSHGMGQAPRLGVG